MMKNLFVSCCVFGLLVSLSSCSFGSVFSKKELPPPTTVQEETDTKETKIIQFSLKVGSPVIYVDNQPVELEVPVQEIDGRTMVPLTFFKEYCQMEDIQYDPTSEVISFSMPGILSEKTEETITTTLVAPGKLNQWYTIHYQDPFTGKTTLSIMVENIVAGEEANQMVADKDPLNPTPPEGKQYIIATLRIRLDALETTENYPLNEEDIVFLTSTGEQVSSEDIIKSLDMPLESVLKTGQEIHSQYAVLSSITESPVVVFMHRSETPIFITLKQQ